ncbi:DUF2069 domain-containing protein [Cognatiluteimonas lumbrici]|uniref:DUF2069 domain-containing protein n=1 Tax=Cognatiluteimonas lumbrici TaxID=2559601 RepID=UPI00112E8E4A|nr:DUF2069 domain-containing protein [Luteimonas lumbrici]
MTPARRIVRLALIALVVLFASWFGIEGDRVALLVFALPPLLLAWWLPRAPALAGFWAGVLALAWFSHGIMVAWSRPPERWPALAEVALALVVVLAASVPGLRARFARGGKPGRVP